MLEVPLWGLTSVDLYSSKSFVLIAAYLWGVKLNVLQSARSAAVRSSFADRPERADVPIRDRPSSERSDQAEERKHKGLGSRRSDVVETYRIWLRESPWREGKAMLELS